jgi:hypothetical protein
MEVLLRRAPNNFLRPGAASAGQNAANVHADKNVSAGARPNRAAASSFAQRYADFSICVTNSLMLFLFLNLLLWPVVAVRDFWHKKNGHPPIEAVEQFGPLLAKVYAEDHPAWTGAEVQQLISETWLRPYIYDRYLEWRERPFRGRFVNVDAQGFRLGAHQGPWPPDPAAANVFLFGGSTTFGYGVADDETLPSNLQPLLAAATHKDVRVYNFGQGGYQSVPEGILFERLLRQGMLPRLAIFVDGLNEFYDLGDMPGSTKFLSAAAEGRMPPGPSLLESLPIYRAAASLERRLQGALYLNLGGHADDFDGWHSDVWKGALNPAVAGPAIQRVMRRYQESTKTIEAVASAYHVSTVFVWQPVPAYKYDLKYHPFYQASRGWTHLTLLSLGYPEMARSAQGLIPDRNFLWCADIQEDSHERLYVDSIHYSVKLNGMLAGCIARGLASQHLMEFRDP